MTQRAGAMKADADLELCIKNCQDCRRVCLETIPHRLSMGGPHAEPDHIRLLQDCVQICQTSADFMIRNSDLHGRVCGACAAVCEHCAQDCERLAAGDPQMKACADVCHRCAESCRRMASAMAA